MTPYNADAWRAIGAEVRRARKAAGYTSTPEWAALIGRSTRVVLGLERGEPVGDDTLHRIAQVLGWKPTVLYEVLSGRLELTTGAGKSHAVVETVGAVPEADDFVATGSGGTKGISNEEVLERIRRMREELDEIERGLAGGGT